MDVSGIEKAFASFKDRTPNNILPNITLSELEKHDGSDPNVSYWTVLYGIVYDVSDWSSIHPGGSRMIRLISGRDGTPFIESYHHFNAVKRVSSVIINQLSNKIIGKFKPNHNDEQYTIIKKAPKCGNNAFYNTLSERVDHYLKSNNISYNGYSPVFNYCDCIFTLILYFITAIGTWYHTVYYTEYLWAIFHAIICVRCGYLQHMANHRAYSSIFMNECVGAFMDLLGVDSNMWLLKHQVLHHIAPNVLGIDTDIVSGNPWARFHPLQPIKWYHKYQYLYIPFAVGFVTLSWYITEIVVGIQLLLRRKVVLKLKYGFHINWNTFNTMNWFFGKIWLFIIYLGLKVLFVDDYSYTMPVVVVWFYTLGIGLMGTFILNHTNSDDLFADTNENECDNMHWSVLQVHNSANWASTSRFWCFMSGGLNHQIEHHLFPSMHHQNYALISHIVEETCKEFGIPYRDEGNLIQCLLKVEKYLYDMGRAKTE